MRTVSPMFASVLDCGKQPARAAETAAWAVLSVHHQGVHVHRRRFTSGYLARRSEAAALVEADRIAVGLGTDGPKSEMTPCRSGQLATHTAASELRLHDDVADDAMTGTFEVSSASRSVRSGFIDESLIATDRSGHDPEECQVLARDRGRQRFWS